MYKGRKVFDIRGHVSAPLSLYTPVLLMLASNSPLRSTVRTGGVPPILPYDLGELERPVEYHLKRLDERNIDVQVIGPRPLLRFGWMPSHLIEACTELVNDLIQAQCRLAPDRFLGAAQLPQRVDAPDSHHMLAELNRCVLEMGFVAAYVSPDPSGTRNTPGLHARYWDPLFERATHLDVPIIVHASPSRDDRAADIFLNYQLGFVTEQYLAREFLSRGHVFDRHPDLRVLICHCGGMLDRFPDSDGLHVVQDDLSSNLFFDTCAYDLNLLAAAIRQRGPASMCFGSEVPNFSTPQRDGDGRFVDDLVHRIDGFDWLTDAEKEAVFHDNPLRLCHGLSADGTPPPAGGSRLG